MEQGLINIVELDSYAANPGDLSWENFMKMEGCRFTGYLRTPAALTVERAKEADIVLTNKVVMSEEVMSQLPRLKYIGVMATGYNVVDMEAARRRGIIVTNIPAYSTMSVAQMVWAHLLNVTQQVALHDAAVKAGEWERSEDFCFYKASLCELDGKTMGIVGLGNIGMAVARIAKAFGMKVLAYTSKTEVEEGITATRSYERLFSESDVVTLHCPLTPETHHLVNRERLRLMRPTAILINTGRGPLVDEEALCEALREGKLGAACLDVLTQEPPVSLPEAPNLYFTPHLAWGTREARARLLDVAAENIRAFLRGKPRNVVS